MESPSENPSPPTAQSPIATGGGPHFSLGSSIGRLLGPVFAVLVVGAWQFIAPSPFSALAVLAVLVLTPVIIPLAWAHEGRLRGWSATAVRRGSIAFIVLWLAGVGWVIVTSFHKVRDTSKLKTMYPRQMAAAVDQFYLEFSHRIFASYRDLVGPRQYIKAYNPVDGEDMSIQFPIRRDWSNPLSVRLPDGTTVQRYEVIAVVGRSGLIATCPGPQEYQSGGLQHDRVYRLDCGISYRGDHVVDLPPDPAGREGRDQDGVHIYQLTDGSRFEITYRGGVPDGPFRAFFPDGKPWGEATYQKGRLVGPSWLILPDGRKIDELADGEVAEALMAGDLAAAMVVVKARASEKMRAGGIEGAIEDWNYALSLSPRDSEAYRFRGNAYRKLGNLDRAIADYSAADGHTPEQAADYQLPSHLQEVFLERWKLRSAKGDIPGATADARVVIKTAVWNAEAHLNNNQPGSAAEALIPALAIGPQGEVMELLARASWMQNRLAEAETDYTRAIELAEAGKLQTAANGLLLSSHYHYQRGHVRRWLGKSAEAAADFRAAGPLLGNSGAVRQGHAALWRFITTLEAGHKDEAAADLTATDRTGWWPHEGELADFLLGKISEEQLAAQVAKSNQDDDRLLASLFTGIRHAQAGDAAGAGEHYRKAAQFSAQDFMAKEAARRAFRPFAAKLEPVPVYPPAKNRASASTPAPAEEKARLVAAYDKAAARDYAGAEAEVTALIDSGAPKSGYFLRRARLRFFRGNLDGAIEDYDRAERLTPYPSQFIFERAHVRRAQHDLDGAARGFRAVLAMEGKQFNSTSGRVAFWLYVTDCERGRGDAARRELEANMQALATLKKDGILQDIANFDAQLAGLLLGRIGEPQAEAAVQAAPARAQPDSRFEFLFFSALARRLDGDEAGAREQFQLALGARTNTDGYDYERAEAEKALASPVQPAPVPNPAK